MQQTETSYYQTIRRKLHSNPGVSGSEWFAHDLVVSELHNLHPTEVHEHVGGYGVVAFWKSPNPDARTLAFRADIDALPIGHRCGHDGHTAVMLCFAEMVDREQERKCNVVLVFQPEEETGRGAAKIVESGILQRYKVDAIFAFHNLPGFAEGTVVLNEGTFAAASTGVVYRLQGRATHASTPEKGINPGLASAEIIQRFSSTLNTGASSSDTRQSTLVCCRIGEEAFGTSAGSAEIMFTLRAFTNSAMHLLLDSADSIVRETAQREHLQVARELREPFRATENTTDLVRRMRQILEPFHTVVTLDRPFRWSEDFAEYLQLFPGVLFGIGSGVNHPELHHPEYDFPDGIIRGAADCFRMIKDNVLK